MKSCIAVLNRGYNDIKKYSDLIKRNKCIAKNLNDKQIDILIFHEGNINKQHQIYIQNETLELELKFINVLDIAFNKEKEEIIIEEAHNFGIGYRHMCSFWFVNFYHIVKEYDKMLRIDEDCFIDFNIDNILLDLDTYIFTTGMLQYDAKFVTIGINDFSIEFMKNHEYEFKRNDKKNPNGPYTNIIGISLEKIRKNDTFIKYVEEIDKSNMIYKRRWGDLPLWGEVIYYIFGLDTLKINKDIKYFHGSHNLKVNYNL